jgi:AbrB family looped-hinge helix DNA binding protein
MLTTRISSKGQIVIPKAIRDRHNWKPGTQLLVEERAGSVVLSPGKGGEATRPEDVYGCLNYSGPTITLEAMEQAIEVEVKRRHARGRY